MSNRIDTTQYECAYNSDLYYKIRMWMRGDNEPDEIAIGIMSLYSDPIAELKRCYREIDDLQMLLGQLGLAKCPRSHQWFDWDNGCPHEEYASFDDDCRELFLRQYASE